MRPVAQAPLAQAADRLRSQADLLRMRGDIFLEHEAAGAPPASMVEYIVGTVAEMEPRTLERLSKMQRLLALPPLTEQQETAA